MFGVGIHKRVALVYSKAARSSHYHRQRFHVPITSSSYFLLPILEIQFTSTDVDSSNSSIPIQWSQSKHAAPTLI